MSNKKILTVELELASTDCQFSRFSSKMSLLDWDIVLFKPLINEFISPYDGKYQGRASLNDDSSFQLKECCAHWRREIKQAFETGKTVMIFLPALEEIYVDTGQRSYSGTGRNQKTTRHVEPYDNYQAIPATLSPITAQGRAMKLSTRGTEYISALWSELADVSQYEVILTAPDVPVCLMTRTGDKTVGALYRSKTSSGTLLLLPNVDFYPDHFLKEKGVKQTWTAAATQFGARMVGAIVALDKALHSSGEVTPTPGWAAMPLFALRTEQSIRVQLLEAEQQVEMAQQRKESIVEQLKSAGNLRGLLFEKGKPLENAIIEALRMFGFKAAQFRDSSSEFDVVFESKEGRLIGEAEGKDNKAISIDKMRQLAMNIHEDLQREEVSSPAKPVLFGNAFRLQPLADRADPFTEKCYSAAASSATALVFTPDMFAPVQYLVDHPDEDYAQKCRMAVLSATGKVVFPVPPAFPQPEVQTETVPKN